MKEKGRFNTAHRVLGRQIFGSPPGSTVAKQRQWFETIIPDDQAKEVEPPDCYICKFLPSGNLVCFGNMQHDIVVFRYTGYHKSITPGNVGPIPFPSRLPFNSFFQEKYRRLLAHGHELLCKELCLVAPGERFLIVASCTAPVHPSAQQPGAAAVHGLPLVASTTLHVIRAEDGELCGRYQILDDFVHLSHANGVFLLDNLLCLLAVRSQTVHILHITDSGKLVVSQKLGTFCRDDDELALSRCREAEQTFHSQVEVVGVEEREQSGRAASPGPLSQALAAEAARQAAAFGTGRGLSGGGMQRAASAPLPLEPVWSEVLTPLGAQRWRQPGPPRHLSRAAGHDSAPGQAAAQNGTQRPGRWGIIEGVRQRLMAYLFLHSCSKNGDAEARKLFFYHFEDYANLAMWKVQMLDREHLLISMGPPDAGLVREGSGAAQSYCLLVWSIPQARVMDLHDASSTTLLQLYQSHWQYFHAGCILSPWHRFLTPSAGCRTRVSFSTPTAVVRRILSNLPASSQVMSPSPYLDARLFQYDEKLISAMIRPRPFTETPLKFAARSRSERPRFKLQPAGGEVAGPGTRPGRQLVAYHFHPWLPVVLCIVQSFGAPAQLTLFLSSQ